jgi:hypothetical protein
MIGWVAVGTIAVAASSVAALGSLVWIRVKRLKQPRMGRNDTGFSPERYEPMARLLAGDDMEFLRRHTSCAKIASRWERSRRRIFRLYLMDLTSDFHELHAQSRALVAESPEQYSELVGVLMRQQVMFWRAVAALECRLALSALGIGQVDPRRLISAIEAMRLEVEQSVRLASASA